MFSAFAFIAQGALTVVGLVASRWLNGSGQVCRFDLSGSQDTEAIRLLGRELERCHASNRCSGVGDTERIILLLLGVLFGYALGIVGLCAFRRTPLQPLKPLPLPALEDARAKGKPKGKYLTGAEIQYGSDDN